MANENVSKTGQILSVNKFNMYFEVHGSGSPLLLLHGFTGSGASLLPLFSTLTKTHQLIIPDLRGHGRSTNPSKKFTHYQAALDIFALLENLHITKCSAIGFSAGANILLHMATQQPDRIQTMALVSATPYFPETAREIMRQFTIESKEERDWKAMRGIHQQGDEQIRIIWEQAAAFHKSYKDMNFTPPLLSKIKAKTLIVHGDRDPLYPVDIAFEMFRNIPNSDLWIVPNGEHVPLSNNFIQPFINYIINFL
jgi:pimeloyl-ACP methyl ester carboxylesterase